MDGADIRAGTDADREQRGFMTLGSRLRPPRAQLDLVLHEALVRKLAQTSASLILVSAPAGYGKTTVLVQWAESDDRPAAWLQLADVDNDPVAFLTYVAAALAPVAPLDPRLLDLLRLKDPPIERQILPGLGAALAAAPPFLLVLDDGHLVHNEACWRYVDLLFEHLPRGA
jgi:LuxR family maltose regulon positive regulatory protein